MKKLFSNLKKTKSKITYKSLNNWNKTMAALHALQGVLVLVLARDVSFPISTSYLTLDPLASQANGQPALVDATRNIFDINLAYLVAAFFFMSAIAHILVATVYRSTYEANLKRGLNKARWYEYSISASTMMVAIAILSGVYDFSSLIMIFMLVAIMNGMGLMMEIHNQTTKKTDWTSFIIGIKSGIVPWIVIGLYFWGANTYGSGQIPTFVYWIYGSLFVFFNCFAINMYLQYKKIGKWADYLYGERVYMILSLVAKSALAWQVFFGALRP
ncbi:heliorhodopsin HeR [Candidatus Saccharibacteria bacterium]|nr:heliorhodopsin HeR [Candidatus Saccharibacteria bacterium]